ncbi:hypothetical protein HDU96_010748 [Phlyctochytrium bullatum]|nr:hypothetical protein HDU96_010748 [Phlyctochytrium bullatum]
MASSIEQQHPQTPGVPPTSRLRLKFWGITTTLTLSDPVPLSTSGSSVDVQEYRTQLWLSTPGNERGILAATIPVTYSQLLPAGEKFPGEGEPAKNREWVATVWKALTWKRIEKAVWSLVLLGLIAPLITLFVALLHHLKHNSVSIGSSKDIPMTMLHGSIFFSHAMLSQLSSNGFFSHPELGYIPNACRYTHDDWRKLIVDLPFEDTITLQDSLYASTPQIIRYDYRRFAIGDKVDVTLDLQDDPKFKEAWLEMVPGDGRSINATALWKAGNASFEIPKSGWAELPGRNGTDGLWSSEVDIRIRDIFAIGKRWTSIDLGTVKVNGTASVVDPTKTAQHCPAGQHCKVPLPLFPSGCVGVVLSTDTVLRRRYYVGDRRNYDYNFRHEALVIYSPRWATVIPAAALIWGAVLTLLGLVVALWRWEKVPSDKVRAWADRRREGRIALPVEEEAREPLLGA